MRGYPLDPAEKAAVIRALHEIERSSANGSQPRSHEQPEQPRHTKPSDTESSSEA
jgi:hypothetical protein